MLNSYGWSDTLQQQFQTHAACGLTPGRVIVQQRGLYVLATGVGEVTAQLCGRFVHQAQAGNYPVAGDWVAAAIRTHEAAATIQHLLPRRSAFVRKAVGGGRAAQIVAANVDVVLVVAALNGDLNARRIERYLAIAWDSGASPVIVLTKADLCHDYGACRAAIEAVALGVPIHVVSVITKLGLAALADSFAAGQTAVLLGSSGVGKSSLVNALAGSTLLATQAISQGNARGRHTTTFRQLVLLPNGRLLLDTPGMRELGLWEAQEGVATTFADVAALAAQCRFKDCSHRIEPGCAVQAAMADGSLDASRLRSYGKLQRELARDARKDRSIARTIARKIAQQSARDYQTRKKPHPEDDC